MIVYEPVPKNEFERIKQVIEDARKALNNAEREKYALEKRALGYKVQQLPLFKRLVAGEIEIFYYECAAENYFRIGRKRVEKTDLVVQLWEMIDAPQIEWIMQDKFGRNGEEISKATIVTTAS